MHSSQDIEAFLRSTQPTDQSITRVQQSVQAALTIGAPAPDIQSALQQHLPSPGAAAAQRVQARVLASAVRARPVWPTRLLMVGGTAALLGAGGLAVLWAQPSDDPLSEAVRTQRIELSTAVIQADGKGQLGGTELAPELRWEAGTVAFDGTGVIRTREAALRIDGPVDVVRDVFGTRASGAGITDLQCLATYAIPDGFVGCPPVSGPGLLAVAVEQRARGASAGEQLTWLGLAENASDPSIRGELSALQVAAHYDAGNRTEVVSIATAHVQGIDAARRDEVALYGASAALADQDCPAAVPFLRILAPTDPQAALNLAACIAQDANEALEGARRQARDQGDLDQIESMRRSLGEGP